MPDMPEVRPFGMGIEVKGNWVVITLDIDGETRVLPVCEHVANVIADSLHEAAAHLRRTGRGCNEAHDFVPHRGGSC